jgi:hypothetical protein
MYAVNWYRMLISLFFWWPRGDHRLSNELTEGTFGLTTRMQLFPRSVSEYTLPI